MSVITEIVRGVAVVVILCLFVEMLLPRGELVRYVRMMMGLLLIVAVIHPLLGSARSFSFPAVFSGKQIGSTEQILRNGEKLAGVVESMAEKQYREDLCRQMSALALIVSGVEDAEIMVNLQEKQIKGVNIILEVFPSLQAAEVQSVCYKVGVAISNFYSIERGFINVTAQSGGGD